MIYKTACISFPRSGHHALKAVLADYFGNELHYCDNYVDPTTDRLGANEDTNYCKEHDLKLAEPVIPGIRYLIQVRNPIASIQSWIEFDSRVGAINHTASRESWSETFREKLEFWNHWFDKWILSDIWPRLVVPYETLVSNPFSTCESVIQFMTSQHPNPERLRKALERFPIVARPVPPSPFLSFV